jgi:hypothetical protein
MKCPRCQAENDAGARFCEDCGGRLEAACPSCGTPVTPGKKFCRSCGAALTTEPAGRFANPESYTPKHLAEKILTSKTALEGERKQVTVLFADLKGSMELLADRDPEEARKLLDPVLERMMEAGRVGPDRTRRDRRRPRSRETHASSAGGSQGRTRRCARCWPH